uniref:Uncharacterized protein n=1 Tax=Cacopsylla melanoneura TaxID=428564 RepID=A0A8D8WGB4_9HEMI
MGWGQLGQSISRYKLHPISDVYRFPRELLHLGQDQQVPADKEYHQLLKHVSRHCSRKHVLKIYQHFFGSSENVDLFHPQRLRRKCKGGILLVYILISTQYKYEKPCFRSRFLLALKGQHPTKFQHLQLVLP